MSALEEYRFGSCVAVLEGLDCHAQPGAVLWWQLVPTHLLYLLKPRHVTNRVHSCSSLIMTALVFLTLIFVMQKDC